MVSSHQHFLVTQQVFGLRIFMLFIIATSKRKCHSSQNLEHQNTKKTSNIFENYTLYLQLE
jgi:hypothetical protein